MIKLKSLLYLSFILFLLNTSFFSQTSQEIELELIYKDGTTKIIKVPDNLDYYSFSYYYNIVDIKGL